MVPAKTIDIVRSQYERAHSMFEPIEYYALTGNDLNDLAVLAVRLGSGPKLEGDELRDWENRLNLIIDNARKEQVTYEGKI